MHWTTLGTFVALETVLCYIPGPAVLAVVGASLSRPRAGFATAFGILTGNLIYFSVSALGIASIILASHKAFLIIKWCGAAYLAYIGIRALTAKQGAHAAAEPSVSSAGQLKRGWVNGTITQLANPKALVFFVAILPQFIDPRSNLTLQIAILAIAGLVVELGVLSTYILAIEQIRKRGFAPRSRLLAERAGGVFLLGVAAAVVHET
jgi:homoserine/homoserine lactone efflux protein